MSVNRKWGTVVAAGILVTGSLAFQMLTVPAGQAQAAPVLVAQGQFGGAIDAIHHADGTASIYRLGDGTRVLRLGSFQSTNGPNLYVYLSGNASPRNSAELAAAGEFEIGRLKGNIGNQNYTLPASLDLSKFKSVVIYCRQFHVVFGSATLAGR